MPKNIRGGNKAKKSKNSNINDQKIIFIDKEPDQMIGRLMRLPGNLNAQIYCEDNKVRVCKIRKAIKKKVRFEVGDLVLVSLRDMEVSAADLKDKVRGDRGDIIAKYSTEQYSQLKKDGVNPKLFAQIETISALTANHGKDADAVMAALDADDIFETGSASSEELNDSDIDDI